MNKPVFKYIMMILVVVLCSLVAKTQVALRCGDPKMDILAVQMATAYEKNHIQNRDNIQTVNIVIKVFFHIIRLTNGNSPGATSAQITSEYNSLVSSYTGDNICFLNAGFDYINNDYLDTAFVAGVDNSNFFSPYQVPACINVFYPLRIKGSNGACNNTCGIGGTSFQIPNTFCLVGNSNIGKGNTVAHEVGHCMGLFHTFERANGIETINGSNATTAGDLIADTPADPYGLTGSCYDTTANGCSYTGNCPDPNGATNYSPPYTNLMAYWWNGNAVTCYSNLTPTGGQYSRVNATLSTYAPLQSCQSPFNYTLNAFTVSSGYFMQSVINSLTTSGSVNLVGSVISTLGGGHTYLEPGFKASPTSGTITIRPIPCN
ncbi:MAG: hypothetical protein ABIY51_11540 [Ferruginibacter sp.]